MPLLYILLFVYEAASTWTNHHQNHKHHFVHPKIPETTCPGLPSVHRGIISCHHHASHVSCQPKVQVGTIAVYECKKNFIAEPTSIIECLENGTWSSALPNCVPDCGKQTTFVTLILNGADAATGSHPWQVAIYNFLDNAYEFWCGGSLISEFSAITAAHCIWKVPAKNLIAAFGKKFRDFYAEEHGVQNIRVVRVEMLRSYQDVSGNYNGDLSVIFLEKAVQFNAVVKPICLDWKQEHMDEQLEEGSLGTVVGWGLTENDTFSNVLRAVQLPVKADEICIAQQHRDFRKFVTYTSFCAGFRNGSGVCNGDSGGGLAFLDKSSDTWYLQGVVSISPRRKGTSFCDPNFFTVFTKVTVFVKWLKKMKKLEEELVASRVIQSTDDENEIVENEIRVDIDSKAHVGSNKKKGRVSQ